MLLLYTQLLLSQTAKQNEEGLKDVGFQHCVGYQLMKAMLTHPFYVTAFNKKIEFNLRILYRYRAIHKIRSCL